MNDIKIFLPEGEVNTLEKLLTKASKNIEGIIWEISETYKKTFRHVVDGKLQKWSHTIVDATIIIPDVNDWTLLATIVEGNLFVTNPKKELVFKNGHGVNYKICDACGHPQWKKSFVVRNVKTDEELQVGSECAKKFGIGMVNAIYNLTKELYANYNLCSSEYDGLEPILWPAHYSDPRAVRSVETSIIVQAAKKYYDEHNGVWRKGYYSCNIYYPSESAAEIRASLDKFVANDNDEYLKSLRDWINDTFVCSDYYSEFEESIKNIGCNYYTSAGDVAAAFFAIKRFEQYKKEKEAKEKGIYIPKRNDYIHIVGKIVNKTKMKGYFGEYIEYEIFNDIDKNTYKRAGVVKSDENGNVDCYAFVNYAYNGNYTLDRTTKNPKKGVKLANVF